MKILLIQFNIGYSLELEVRKIMSYVDVRNIESNIEARKRKCVNEELMQTVMKRKLNFFGHICRMKNNKTVKSVTVGKMDSSGKRGRPDREWLEDWCQKDIYCLLDRGE
jgi:hypothetical protein